MSYTSTSITSYASTSTTISIIICTLLICLCLVGCALVFPRRFACFTRDDWGQVAMWKVGINFAAGHDGDWAHARPDERAPCMYYASCTHKAGMATSGPRS